MLRLLIGEKEMLPPEIIRKFPELAAARYRRGGLPARVGGWFLGQRSVAAITLWRTIWLGDDTALDEELLLHEFRHVVQFGASRAFPILYIWESVRRGYWMNRYEVEARAYASQRVRDPKSPS